MFPKSRLKEDIRQRLLNDEPAQASIADRVGLKTNSIDVALKNKSPQFCYPHYVQIIKEVLNLPEDEIIWEIYYIQPAFKPEHHANL